MRRAVVYVVLLGLLSGVAAGVAAFGLPLAAEDVAGAPPAVTAFVLAHGLGLADAAVMAVGALAALVLLVALLDLWRSARRAR
jgi:hypothetical protein